IRSLGISFFAYKFLPQKYFINITSSILSGVAFSAHGAYVSYQRVMFNDIKNKIESNQGNQDNNEINGSVIKKAVFFINATSKVAYSITLISSFEAINTILNDAGLDTQLNFNDIVMLVLLFSIPVGLNNFDYYNQKLIEMINYHTKKIKLEQTNATPLFSRFCCFFKSEKSYIKTIDLKNEETLAINLEPGSLLTYN
ncbi:MAG: hypothetical protein HKM04_01910, partial [Legionellales bacterium]|nr:hypothetical protein [Legionellales bacterium]